MAQNRKWTAEEDYTLAVCVKNTEVKSEAFKKASQCTGRSENACSNRWYTALNNPESKAYVGSNFFGLETQEECVENYTGDEKKSLLSRIISKIKSWFHI